MQDQTQQPPQPQQVPQKPIYNAFPQQQQAGWGRMQFPQQQQQQPIVFQQLFGQLMLSQKEVQQLSMQLVHEKDNHKNLAKMSRQLQKDHETLQLKHEELSVKHNDLLAQQKPKRKRKTKQIVAEDSNGVLVEDDTSSKKQKQNVKLRQCNRCGIKNNKVRFAKNGNMCQFHRTGMTKMYTKKRKLDEDCEEYTNIEETIKGYNVFRDQTRDKNIDKDAIEELQVEITEPYHLDPEDEDDQKYLALKDSDEEIENSED